MIKLPTKEEAARYIRENSLILPDDNPKPVPVKGVSTGRNGMRKPVKVYNDNESHTFSSITKASKFLNRSIGATSAASINGTLCAGYHVEKLEVE